MKTKEFKTIYNRISKVFKNAGGSKTNHRVFVSNNGRLAIRAQHCEGFIEESKDALPCENFIYSLSGSEIKLAIESSADIELSPSIKDEVESGNLKIKVSRDHSFDFWDESSAVFQTTILADDLKTLINGSVFACESNSVRFALSGVCIVPTESGMVQFFATDGRRMIVKLENGQSHKNPADFSKVNNEKSIIVSADHLKALAGVLPKTGRVRFTIRSSGRVQFDTDSMRAQFRSVEGRFPNCNSVLDDLLPKREFLFDVKTSYAVKAMIGAIEDATERSMVDGVLGDPHFDLIIESGMIRFGKIDWAKTGEDKTYRARFNSKYLIEFLKTVKTEMIDIYSTGGDSALIVETFDSVYALMPMSTK